MTEPWAGGIFLLIATLGIPGVALFLTWPRSRATADSPATDEKAARESAIAEDDGFDAERSLVAVSIPASVFTLFTELVADMHRLTAAVVWGYAVVVSAGGIAGLFVLRRSWLARLRRPGILRRWLARVPAVGLVLAAASAQIAIVLKRTDSLIGPTPWYYWQQSALIASAERVPARSREWGIAVDFFDYHLGFNTFGAAIAKATYAVHSLFGAQLVRALVALSAVIAMWLFARAWGAPRYAAAAAAIAVPCITIFANKLASYRPETAGYLFALAAAALLHRWFLRPRWLLAAATLATFAAVTQIHAPASIVAAALCAGTAFAHLRWSWRWVVQALAVGLALVVVWFAADLITGHRGPFSEQFAEPPVIATGGKDPTYEFAQLATLSNPAARPELGVNPPPGRSQLEKSLTGGFLVGGRTSYWSLIGAGLATLAAAIALRRWMIVRYMVAGIVFMGLLGAVLVFAQLGWDTYVPHRTGYSRFINFWWFFPLAAVSLSARLIPRKWYRVTISAVLVVVASGLWFASLDATGTLDRQQPSAQTLEQLRALQIPPGAIVLSNAFTQDFVQYNTPGDGLTDGRAPYLERGLLTRANTILRHATAFFADPVGKPFPWDRYNVGYVLVSTLPSSLGTPVIYMTNPVILDTLPDLMHIKSGEGWVLYRVKR